MAARLEIISQTVVRAGVLDNHDEVWTAAGTCNDVFGIEPQKLVDASGGALTDLKRG